VSLPTGGDTAVRLDSILPSRSSLHSGLIPGVFISTCCLGRPVPWRRLALTPAVLTAWPCAGFVKSGDGTPLSSHSFLSVQTSLPATRGLRFPWIVPCSRTSERRSFCHSVYVAALWRIDSSGGAGSAADSANAPRHTLRFRL
jgi:hypothetical protein